MMGQSNIADGKNKNEKQYDSFYVSSQWKHERMLWTKKVAEALDRFHTRDIRPFPGRLVQFTYVTSVFDMNQSSMGVSQCR